MTKTAHQILGSCACRSCQSLAGVPQIMKTEARYSSLVTSASEGLAHRITTHR